MSTNNESQKGLRKGAIGLTAVLFMAVANAAPITAMSFNVPIGAGYGNGLGVPAGFLFATIVLSIFAIGFSAMAKHITTAGAFYGFISHGLGQVWGMAAGLLATIAYILFEGTLIGGFAFFAANTLSSMAGIEINWLIIAIGGMILIWVLTYFDITVAATVLGVTLVAEVLLLLAFIIYKRRSKVPLNENDGNFSVIGLFKFYPEQNKLVRQATEINLSKKECELLALFVERPNQIIKRDELSKKVWEDQGVIVGRSLDTYISKLRKILKDDDSIKLSNIHGVGYKLEVKK